MDDLVIDEKNFNEYFFDVRQHKPQRGQVMARYRGMAEFVDANSGPCLKRDVIDLLKKPAKADAAVKVMRKLGCCIEEDCYRVLKEMAQDLISGMSDDEVAAKVYKYTIELFFYTRREYVPINDIHWDLVELSNLDNFLDKEQCEE